MINRFLWWKSPRCGRFFNFTGDPDSVSGDPQSYAVDRHSDSGDHATNTSDLPYKDFLKVGFLW